jgi:threonine aldolase
MSDAERNFLSDNVVPMADEVLAALAQANRDSVHSYGEDPYTERCTAALSTLFETEVVCLPVATGTAANAIALAAMTPPYGAIYCHDRAHIVTDECGAPEFYSGGAKLIGVTARDGKLRPEQLREPIELARESGVHHVLPASLSLTQATEWGTVYTPDEIRALADFAHQHGLRVHVDGARLANAIAHLGCSPAEATWRAGVDALSFGVTKNGGMAAEAVVFFDPRLAQDAALRRKRSGHLWSKGRFLAAQLLACVSDGLWLRLARHANAMATRLATGLAQLPDLHLVQRVEANEIFAHMPDALIHALRSEGFEFYLWPTPPGEAAPVVRLVTSYRTTPAAVDALIAAAQRHLRAGS